MLREALAGDTWISDLAHGNTNNVLHEFLALRRWIASADIRLQDDCDDTITCRFSANGYYSTALAYQMQVEGHTRSLFKKRLWTAWAPGRLKFFTFLPRDRLWCNDRLQRR